MSLLWASCFHSSDRILLRNSSLRIQKPVRKKALTVLCTKIDSENLRYTLLYGMQPTVPYFMV